MTPVANNVDRSILQDPSISSFLQIARQDANEIINYNDTTSQPVYYSRIRKIKVGPTYNFTTYNVNSYGGSSSRSDDAALRLFVGIIGTYVAIVAAKLIGKSKAQKEEAENEIENIRQFQGEIAARKVSDRNPLLNQIEQVAKDKLALFKQLKERAETNLYLAISLAASAVLAVSGAVFASGALMTTGTVVGIATLIVIVAKYGYESASNSQERLAKKIKNAVDELIGKESVRIPLFSTLVFA